MFKILFINYHKLIISQEIFKADFTGKTNSIRESKQKKSKSSQHTLKKYAAEHFRPGINVTISRGSSISMAKRTASETLWKHTREPIKAPLLIKLVEQNDLAQHAVNIFSNILKYMGDLPSNRPKNGTEYTDQIFRPALEQVSTFFSFIQLIKTIKLITKITILFIKRNFINSNQFIEYEFQFLRKR